MLIKKIIIGYLWLIASLTFALDLELTQGINSALPIAVNQFGSVEQGLLLTDIISSDLRLSGQFALKQAGADSVVTGRVTPIGANRYEVSMQLLDAVAQGKTLLSKTFQVTANQIRPLAHHISDLVYEKLTGARGIFSTRIAYVLVQRQAGRARYMLEVADADGHNPQTLFSSPEPVMSPAWSPDGRQLAFVSYEKKKAQIFTVDLETGRRRLVTDFAGINGAPAWSPNGKQLAVVLSKSGTPKIYTVDLSSGQLKQLTFGEAIDTEPRYSPDGRNLLFTSGRGGSPQIYRLSLADGSINRVTFEGNYNARAMYTPDQRQIVMMHREDKGFSIGVQDAASGQLNVLSSSALDESPSVSPNGRLVLYATRHHDQGVLGVVSIDGRIQIRFPAREGDVQEPAWSPYLN